MTRAMNACQLKLELIEAMLLDARLSGQDVRVGAYVVLRANFDKLTEISQSEIGDAVRVQANHVSASIKQLCSQKTKYLGRSKAAIPHRYKLKERSD